MAHKTLIGGTAYEIGGGKDLIGGTVYAKDHGKTLVGGTVYEVGFAPAGATVKVTVSNTGLIASQTSSPNAHFSIDGVKHNVAEEFVTPIGTVLSCWCSRGSGAGGIAGIYLNGAEVQYKINDRYQATYEYTVKSNVEIVLSSGITMNSSNMTSYKSYIYITEL